MKKYNTYILEKVSANQETFLNIIIKYLNKEIDFNLYPYYDTFKVRKLSNSLTLNGKLYLTDISKAVRFNFNNRNIYSIDLWLDFKFNKDDLYYNKPTYTMKVDDSILQYLDDVINFINGDIEMNEKKEEEVEFEVEHTKDIHISSDENVALDKLIISKAILNEDYDIFEAMKMFVRQVASGISNSLVITGSSGLGKTYDVKEALTSMRANYKFYSGDISDAALYETLFLHREKLIVFDDIDSVFEGKAVNILKAILDTFKVRTVTRALKTHFNSDGMSDYEIEQKYEETGKLPRQFDFTGQVIFITNLDSKKIDSALISRSLHVDIQLNRDEVLERMRNIMKTLYPKIPMEHKEEALMFLDYIVMNYKTKFPLNIRTLIHAINTRISNDFDIEHQGEKVPAWQMLVKKYLVEKE